MEIALIIFLAVALVVCLGLLIFKPGSVAVSRPKPKPKESPAKAEDDKSDAAFQQSSAASSQEALAKAAEFQKAKGELQKNKEELKQSKQKLFEAREKNKQLETELKTQKQLERQALLETESLRLQLTDFSTELHRLRMELETQKPSSSSSKMSVLPPVPPPASNAELVKPAPKPAKQTRELSPAEKEKVENAERLIAAEHLRTQELEKELKTLKIRFELVLRQLKASQSESKLQKDKFRALEKRLNRTLLERDFILRAMRDLESRCGLQAAVAELPAEDAVAETSEDFSDFEDKENVSEFAEDPENTAAPVENSEDVSKSSENAHDNSALVLEDISALFKSTKNTAKKAQATEEAD